MRLLKSLTKCCSEVITHALRHKIIMRNSLLHRATDGIYLLELYHIDGRLLLSMPVIMSLRRDLKHT